MRLEILGIPGELAANPDQALDALAKAAEADGADREDWVEKALISVGATGRSVPVSREPAYRVAKDVTAQAHQLYLVAMTQAREAVRERLERAAREADTTRYAALLKE